MSEQAAMAVWTAVGAYLGLGLLVLVWLLAAGGLARLDPLAQAAPVRVKLLTAPGLVALWPIVLLRACGVRPPEDRP
jgi:hypothetical protein